jgi:hypothetical protein
MESKPHILLVNFDFPPNRGIGGRRWAKFARQLVETGYVVHVIKADPLPGAADSAWKEDAQHPDIRITSLPRNYPKAFSHPGKDIFSKIKYRYYKWQLERATEGTIYDLSIGWASILVPAIRQIVQSHHIRQLIATGAPWQMLYDVCSIKKEFPGIHYLIDFRDPWITAINYGMAGLSPARKAAESAKQTFVLEHADVVTTPAQHITDELRDWAKQHCHHQAQFELLSHFYDPSDFLRKEKAEKHHSEQITFVYGGDLYVGMEPQLNNLRKQIEEVQAKRPDLYKRMKFRIFTNSASNLLNGIDAVEILPSIGKKLIDEIFAAQYCLVLLPDNKRNDMTTKFVEYFAYRKPMLVVASTGRASDFVEHHKIGLRLNEAEHNLINIMDRAIQGKFPYDNNFEFESYALPAVTEKLISLLSPTVR